MPALPGSENACPAFWNIRLLSVEMSAATATAAGSRSLFRSPATTGLIGFAFDADDGKDQDDAHRFA
jgi:hypothetical protein